MTRRTHAASSAMLLLASGFVTWPARSHAEDFGDAAVFECGTSRIHNLQRSARAEDREELRALMDARGDLPESLETEHFLFLYTLDPANPNHTTAAYMDQLASHLEYAWDVYTLDPRFLMPEAHGAGPLGTAGRPLILVFVLYLEELGGASYVEGPVTGACPNSCSGSIIIRGTLDEDRVAPISAHELWHTFTYAIDPGQASWVNESTAQWATWSVWPDRRLQLGISFLMHTPYNAFDNSDIFHWRRYGAGVFWVFLEERLGAPIAADTWKQACPGSMWEALRSVTLAEHGADLDDLQAEFWRWNYYTGELHDGRHYRNGSHYPGIGYQQVERSLSAAPRSLPDSLVAEAAATNAILFLGPASREHLRITFRGEPELASLRTCTALVTSWPNTHVFEIIRSPDEDGECVFEIADWAQYDQVGLLISNDEAAAAFPDKMGFTWTAEEHGGPVFDVLWGVSAETLRSEPLMTAPNPFSAATMIRYHAGAGHATQLAVFDVSGRLVRSLVADFRSERGGDYNLAWDGRDDAGSAVTSGIYYLRLVSGATERTRPLAVVR